MFGYVMANRDALSQDERDRFQALYCGLCRALRTRHELRGQMTLSFDMTFLLMTLNSLYEPIEKRGRERCWMRPGKRHAYVLTMFSDYAADMNVALAYHKFRDDWADDRNLVRRTEAGLLRRSYRRVELLYPEKCAAVEKGIRALSEIEKRRGGGIDAPANCFGQLLGELFAYRDDHWAGTLRSMGAELGKFIYVMDAYDDLEDDRKKGAYNPLSELGGEAFEETVHAALTMLIARCTGEFEKLPLFEDVEILRNILYSGVWTQYLSIQARRKGEAK